MYSLSVCPAAQKNQAQTCCPIHRFVHRLYGRTVTPMSCHDDDEGGWKALYASLHTIQLGSPGSQLVGWCEDRWTAGGKPYTMDLGGFSNAAALPPDAAICVYSGISTWSYTQPTPKTKIWLCPMKSGAVKIVTLH